MRAPTASADGQYEVRSRVDVARGTLRGETSNPEDETSVPTSKRNCKAKNGSAAESRFGVAPQRPSN
jgi:hypothetical protein